MKPEWTLVIFGGSAQWTYVNIWKGEDGNNITSQHIMLGLGHEETGRPGGGTWVSGYFIFE